MKTKYLSATVRPVILAIITFLVASIFTNPTLANNGPHGNYTPLTDACAGCHRAHTASGARLLLGTVPDFCLTCHGSSATGAETNVIDGRYSSTNENLLGGGFTNYDGLSSTSSHSIDGSFQNAWGSGRSLAAFNTFDCANCHTPLSVPLPIAEWQVSAGAEAMAGNYIGQNIMMPLTCTNCHRPHGSPNYRILNEWLHPDNNWNFIDGTANITDVTSNEIGGQNPDQAGYAPVYTTTLYREKLGTWCTGCHFLYHEKQSAKLFNAEDGKGAITRYRHAMNTTLTMAPPVAETTTTLTTTLPLEDTGGDGMDGDDDQLFCLTCHFAHGTNANMSAAANVLPTNDSALLRRENRGVCQDCHKK